MRVKSSISSFCLAAILSALNLCAYGQDSAQTKGMEQVVVTGQYSPNNPEKAVQRIKIIDRKKIDLMNAQNLGDVLSNELNVRISRDNILGSGMSIGGISGRNVKILVDGVPVIGRLDGNIDITQLNLFNVERIEIIEGPMSVSYGTDAIAGTVNLITKKTRKELWSTGITTYYETTGTYNINASGSYHKKKQTLSLNAGRNFFDGWNPGEKPLDFKPRIADSGRVFQSRPREQYFGTLQYSYNIKNTLISYKGDVFKEKITNRGYPIVRGETAYDECYHTQRIDNSISLSSYFKKSGKLNILAAYNDYKRVKNSFENNLLTFNKRLTAGDGDQDTSKYNQFNSRGTYSDELSRYIAYEAGYDLNLQNGTGRRIKNYKQFIGDYAVYASAELKPWEGITIRPGLRYAYNTSYKAPLIPSVNIRQKVSEHITARASYSRGFRAPDLKELYFYFYDVNHEIKGNENLKAEYSNNANASLCYMGITGNAKYKADVSGFVNDVRDRIELVPTYVTPKEYTYVNISVYKTHGIQGNFDITAGKFQLSAGGQYTGLYNQLYETDNTINKFSYATEIRANINYSWAAKGFTAAVFLKYTGRQPGFSLDTAGNVVPTYIDAYTNADVSLSKKLMKGQVNVSVGCKNLMNITTINSTMITTGTHSSNSVGGQNGRLYFIRLDLKFSDNEKKDD